MASGCDVDLFDEETEEEKKTTEEHAADNYSVSQIAFYSPPIEEVIQRISHSLGTSDNTNVVIDHGEVPIIVKLLASPSDDVREQVELSHKDAELRLLEIRNNYIYQIFPLDQEIESIGDQYWALRVEEVILYWVLEADHLNYFATANSLKKKFKYKMTEVELLLYAYNLDYTPFPPPQRVEDSQIVQSHLNIIIVGYLIVIVPAMDKRITRCSERLEAWLHCFSRKGFKCCYRFIHGCYTSVASHSMSNFRRSGASQKQQHQEILELQSESK
ncbi:ubiquitin carboxyl-terminal hydrolase 12-like protein isoform X2, partial [Tanacetum coccineum]